MLLNEMITPVTVTGFIVIFAGFVILEYQALAKELPRLRVVLDSVRIRT